MTREEFKKKWKIGEEENSSPSSSKGGAITQRYLREKYAKTYEEGASALNDIYSGWQSPEQGAYNMDMARNAIKSLSDMGGQYGDTSFGNHISTLVNNYLGADDVLNAYSGYVTADAYNKAQKKFDFANKYRGASYDDIQKALASATDIDEQKFLKGYTDYSSLEDFDKAIEAEEKIRQNVNAKNVVSAYQESLKEARNKYEAATKYDKYAPLVNDEDFEKYSDPTQILNAEYGLDTDFYKENKKLFDRGIASGSFNAVRLSDMNEEMQRMGAYIYNTQGEEAYLEYMREMTDYVRNEQANAKTELWSGYAENHPVATTIGSTLLQPIVGGLAGVDQALSNASGYKSVSPLSGLSSAMSGATSEISQRIKEENGGLPAFAYDVFTTGVPNRIGQAMFGSAYNIVMGLSSFSTTYANAVQQGTDPDRAVRDAFVAGAIEYLTEQIGMDWAFGKGKNVVTTILKQAFAEGSEEVVGAVAQAIYDAGANGAESEYNQNIQKYIEMGYSRAEAIKKAQLDFAKDVAYQFAVAAFSTVPTTGAAEVRRVAQESSAGKFVNREKMAEISDEKLQKKYGEEWTKKATNREIYKAYGNYVENLQNESTKAEKEATRKAIAEEYKMTEDQADKWVEALYNGDKKLLKTGLGAMLTNDVRQNKGFAQRIDSTETDKIATKIRDAFKMIKSENEMAADKASKVIKTGEKNLVNGKEAEIISMKENKDGSYTVKTSEGNVKASDVTVTENKATALTYSANIENEIFKEAYVRYYKGQDIADYDTYARYLYQAGRQGVDYSDETQILDALGTDVARALYNVGAMEALQEEIEDSKALEEIAKKYKEKYRPGTFKSGEYKNGKFKENKDFFRNLNRTQKKLYRIVESFSSLSGINVRVYIDREAASENGQFIAGRNGGTIYINLAARPFGDSAYGINQYVVSTLSHELTHWLKANNREAYDILEEAVKKDLQKNKTLEKRLSTERETLLKTHENELKEAGKSEEEIKAELEKYSKKKDLDEIAMEEVVARACEDMLNNSDTMEEVLSFADQDGLTKLQNALKKWFDHIRQFFNDLMGGFHAPNEVVADLQKSYDHLRELWVNGMKEAIAQNRREQKTTESKNTIKDNHLKSTKLSSMGYTDQEHTSAGTSLKQNASTFTTFQFDDGERILDWGGGRYDISKRVVEKSYNNVTFEAVDQFNRTEEHNSRVLKEFAKNKATSLTINNVFNVIDSEATIESILAESKKYLKDDGMCYIHIYTGNRSGIGRETSAGYQRNETADKYEKYVKKYYKNVRRAGDFILASDGEIKVKKLDEAHKNLIKKNTESVSKMDDLDMRESRYSTKMDSEGRTLSEGQQNYFEDSKARDDQGRLLVMYHGTDSYEDFTVFKAGKDGYLGKGIYFTEKENIAKRYAEQNGYEGRIYKVYLNVKNPLIVTSENPALEILGEKVAQKRAEKNSFSTKWLTSADIKKLQAKGYDGIIWKYGKSPVEISVWDSNQIKLTTNENPTSDKDIRRSVKMDSKGKTLTEDQVNFFADESPLLLDESGRLKRYYHGTARKDRVGYIFSPEKATSGPMAYFTDSEEIATNYSKDKADTSISRDDRYNDYHTQFRITINGQDMSISDAWNKLPSSKRNEIKQKAEHVTLDDEAEEIIYDPNNKKGIGDFNAYEINFHKGNYIDTLVSSWLDSGTLWQRESDFLKVLEMVGFDLKDITYLDPNYSDAGVYEVYLHITNPLDTSNIPSSVIKAIREASKTAKFDAEASYTADMWDKSNVSPQIFMERFEDDIKNGSSHWATSIPDWTTDVLKSLGYDGIADKGGKFHEVEHQVVIPFYSEQVKDINNEHPTTNPDIRKSAKMDLSKKNPISFKGKAFWSGSVSLLDGAIEEVHTYEEAERADFHHSLYFSDEQVEKLDSDDNAFFFVNNGEIEMWRDDIPQWVIGRIYEQLDSKGKNSEVETIGAADVDAKTGTAVYSVRYTLAERYKELGYNSYAEAVGKMAADIAKKMKVSKLKAKQWIEAEESLASLILNDAENQRYLDYMADDRYSAIKSDTDYPQGTVDLSNLCRKREIFTKMFDSLQRENPDTLFTAEDIAKIRQILTEEKYEVACALCYVEDRRQKIGEIAQSFTNEYKKALGSKDKVIHFINSKGEVKPLLVTEEQALKHGLKQGQPFKATDPYIPNQYDLATYQGYKELTEKHPTVAIAFERFNNARGQSAARLIEGHAEYKREILDWKEADIKKANNHGGLRVFSFSDFEAIHLIDIVQVVMDCSTKGVMIQAYTKVPSFANLVKDTGIKLNRSLIPANKGSKNAYAYVNGKAVKIDSDMWVEDGIASVNGQDVLAFDTVEGIDITDENFLDMSNNKNVGNILVGISKRQIELAMEDDFVDYIIPFHTNQAGEILEAKGIKSWKNFKTSQLDKKIEGKGNGHGINIYTDVINKYKIRNKNDFVRAFLNECKNQKYKPRFEEFIKKNSKGDYIYTEGYHKFLVDYKLFDKNGNILKQEAVKPDFDQKLMNKILMADKARSMNMKFSDEIMDKVRNELSNDKRTVKSVKLDSEYMSAVNKGDLTTAQKMVDQAANEAGYTIKGYHGTDAFGFTQFKKTGDGFSFFFSANTDIAKTYVTNNTLASPDVDIKAIGKISDYSKPKRGIKYTEAELRDLAERYNNEFRRPYRGEIKINVEKQTARFSEITSSAYSMASYIYYRKQKGIYDTWLKMENPLVIDGKGENWSNIALGEIAGSFNEWWRKSHPSLTEDDFFRRANTRSIAQYAHEHGYDGIIIKNIYDDGNRLKFHEPVAGDIYAVFNASQIKSADPVTYDNEGNVIPLSERFDDEKKDIRFSTKMDSAGRTLTPGQQDFFKNSKARDDQGRLLVMFHGSKDFGFTVFTPDKSDDKRSLFFTDSKGMAGTYVGDKDKIYEVYLNLQNPFILDAYGGYWNGIIVDEDLKLLDEAAANIYNYVRIVKRLVDYDVDIQDVLLDLGGFKDSTEFFLKEAEENEVEYTEEEKAEFLEAAERADESYRNWDEDEHLDENGEPQSLADYINEHWITSLNTRQLAERAKERGYDGVIIKNVHDNGKFWRQDGVIYEATVAIAFDGDQVKAVTNENPTKDKDIHKSTKLSPEAQRLVDELTLENKRLTEENTALKAEKGIEKAKAEKKAIIDKITEQSQVLSRWLLTNDKNNPVPQSIKEPLGRLLTSINFTKDDYEWRKSKGHLTKAEESLGQRMAKISQLLLEIDQDKVVDKEAYDLSQLDWLPTFSKEFVQIKDAVAKAEASAGETFTLSKMSTEDLQNLSNMITALKTAITNMNKCMSAHNKMSVSGIGRAIVDYLDEVGQKKIDNRALQFLEIDNTVPFYFFKRLGSGGQTAFKLLMDGMNQYAFEAKLIEDYAKKTFSGKDVNAWRDQVKTFEIDQIEYSAEQGEDLVQSHKTTIRMTVPQIMSLYCLSKRDQAQNHLQSGGIRVGDFKVKSEKEPVRQVDNVTLTKADLQKIISSLDEDQKNVADKLQEFMNTTLQKWGNEVTMKRFGFKGMTEKNYFPIAVDRNVLSSQARQKGTSLYQLLNMGFTKPINPKAKNPIEIFDIFEVFAMHSTEMAQYHSLALPVLDVIRIWNYKDLEMLDEGENKAHWHSVKASIENTIGAKGNQYIGRLLADLNGDVSGGRADDLASRFMKNYKTAAVAANLQVAALQPLSYIRAGYMIDSKYLTKGMAMPSTDDALKWCGIAVWKDMGFYNTAIHRGLEHKIMQDETKKESIIEKGLYLAGKADGWTWSKLWNACLLETKDNYPNLEGDDLYKKTADRLTEVIYGTQVVDSILTRSEIMRDPTFYSKMITAFQSEPTLALNVLMDAGESFAMEARAHGKQAALQKHGATIRRAATIYLISSAVESALRAVIGKIRGYDGDDDDETIVENFLKRFIEELNPLRKIPLIKDAWAILIDGIKVVMGKQYRIYTDTRMDEAIFENIGKSVIRMFKLIEGKEANFKGLYEIAKGLDASGLPVSSTFRAFKVLWNNTIGRIWESLLLK